MTGKQWRYDVSDGNGNSTNGIKSLLLTGLTVFLPILFSLGGAWAIFIRPQEKENERAMQEVRAGKEYVREVEARLLKMLSDLKDAERETRGRSEDNRNSIVHLNEALREVETQFGAVSQLRNVQQENTMRTLKLLWGRVYNEEMPGEVFFPHVGNGSKK